MLYNLLFLALLFATTVILGAIQKPLFLIWYHTLASGCDAADFAGVVANGLKLDITIAGYITALPLLIMLVALWLPNGGGKATKRIIRVYLCVMAAIVAVLFAGNLSLYGYWSFPLDGSVMQYLADPKHAAASVPVGEAIAYSTIALLYFAFEVWIYSLTLRLLRPCSAKLAVKFGVACALLLAIGLDFLAIRGGTTTATANVSKVYFSGNMFLNHAAVNPTFSLLSSLSKRGAEGADYHFFEDEQCAEIVASLRDSEAVEQESLLRSSRPDIILILAESFGRSTADAVVNGEAVAPNFQRLKKEGIYFENIYASSFRTDRGTAATLSGFPAQTKSSIMKSPAKSRHLASIARSLRREGYTTRFIHGGDLNFTNMASYLYSTGYDHLTDLKSLDKDAPTGKWGYDDEVMAEVFLEDIEEEQSPLFSTWLTLSSHEPFDVPEHHFDDPMLNSMWFVDKQIARVVASLKESSRWDNTLVIIIADHAYPYPYGVANSSPERHHIPMLWLGGAIAQSRTIATYASQTDIAATLLAQLGITQDDFPFSRNIMKSSTPHFGYYVFNNGFGVVDERGTTIFDCTSGRTISQFESAQHIDYGKALLQATYRTIEAL